MVTKSGSPESSASALAEVISDLCITDTLIENGVPGEAILSTMLTNIEAGRLGELIRIAEGILGDQSGNPDPRLSKKLTAEEITTPMPLLMPKLTKIMQGRIIDFLALPPEQRMAHQEELERIYQGLTPSRYTNPAFFEDETSQSA